MMDGRVLPQVCLSFVVLLHTTITPWVGQVIVQRR